MASRSFLKASTFIGIAVVAMSIGLAVGYAVAAFGMPVAIAAFIVASGLAFWRFARQLDRMDKSGRLDEIVAENKKRPTADN